MYKLLKIFVGVVALLLIVVVVVSLKPTSANSDYTPPAAKISENKYFVYVSESGQVFAMSSSPETPDETSWERQGYLRVAVDKSVFPQIDRDSKLTFDRGVLTKLEYSYNPIRPEITSKEIERAAIQERIKSRTHSEEDLLRYLEIVDGF